MVSGAALSGGGAVAAIRRHRGRGARHLLDVVYRRDDPSGAARRRRALARGISPRRAKARAERLGGGELFDRRHSPVPTLLALCHDTCEPRTRYVSKPDGPLPPHYGATGGGRTLEAEAAVGYDLPRWSARLRPSPPISPARGRNPAAKPSQCPSARMPSPWTAATHRPVRVPIWPRVMRRVVRVVVRVYHWACAGAGPAGPAALIPAAATAARAEPPEPVNFALPQHRTSY